MKRLALVLVPVALFVVPGELFVRLTGLDWKLLAPSLYYQGADVEVHRASEDPSLVYELRPGASALIRGRRITTNALGFRDKERSLAKPAGVFRVVCLGSSNTYGALVQDGETYPARLEALLNSRGKRRYEVWNAGVSAYNLAQSAAAAEKLAATASPDMIVIQVHSLRRRAFLLGEPFARYFSMDPSLFEENLRRTPLGLGRLEKALLRASALYRAFAFAYNGRPGRSNNPLWESISPGEDALRGLAARRGKQIPIVLLYNPDYGVGVAKELGLPSVRLDDYLPRGAGPEYREIHPPAPVYEWYARALASALPLPKD